ncbi:hypothetical protein [Sphingomicrobium sediminis]|uniref:DUF3617 family protein n=1 Tax=Sphingomicrobium sediminis TaxID=2950949 RepID=A0A9X2EGT8_9SPHN|nr:hypothetical protein [Sphingomicrobium sediminis]MCM8557758.1 hypothetical protein [Sphingomicrobium sediminis]
MRTASRSLAAIALLALAGCAADNPDNIPERGMWEMETRVGTLTVSGMSITGDQLPPEFKAMEGSEAKCGEPLFTEPDWQRRDISRRTNGSCTLDTWDVTAARVTGTGRSELRGSDAEFEPALRVTVEQSPTYYKAIIALEGTADLGAELGRRNIRVSAIQEGRRIGDC